jgi:hypothetical protein
VRLQLLEALAPDARWPPGDEVRSSRPLSAWRRLATMSLMVVG